MDKQRLQVGLPDLRNLAEQYKNGDPSLKETRGFYIRKLFKLINS